MTESEKLYTLEEAAKVLARLECEAKGHDIQNFMRIVGYDGLMKYEAWACVRCKVEFVPKSLCP